jgi:SAM-dependent methyltransferase
VTTHHAHLPAPDCVLVDRELQHRYLPGAESVFDDEERSRFFRDDGVPVDGKRLSWELLYRLEPSLYERLIAGERIHTGIYQWLPESCGTVLELAAGSGRLTLDIADRCTHLIATDPAVPLLALLQRNIAAEGRTNIETARAFFDAIPIASASCDLVIGCSAFMPGCDRDPEGCLQEIRRCCAPGALIVFVWPNDLEWLESRGFRRVVFEGPMAVDFGSVGEALAMTRIFYPDALDDVRERNSSTVPYEVLGMNPPRDLCWMRVS